MDSRRFDQLTAAFATSGSRRSYLGAAIGTALAVVGVDRAEAATFSSDCRKFVLAAGDDPSKKFRHLDDNLLVEVFSKDSGDVTVVWDDTSDNNVNNAGERFRIEPFRARVGDLLRVRAYNLGGPCSLDELWLFCVGDRHGKQLTSRFKSKRAKRCPTDRPFFDETFRIKP